MDDREPNGAGRPLLDGFRVSPGWRDVRRVLAVRLDNLGDVLMLGPALRSIRRTLPHAHVTLMASPGGGRAAALLPWVDAVMTERVVWQDASARLHLDPDRELALVRRIADHGFDAAIIFTSFSQSPWPAAYASYLAGVPLRAAQAGDFGGSLLTDVVAPVAHDAHQVDRNLHLVQALGFSLAGSHLEVSLSSEAEASAALLLEQVGLDLDKPFVALAPGAGCAARRYPAERFSVVAQSLADKGFPVVVLGTSGEAELGAAILDPNAGRPVFSLVGRTEVPQLAAVLARSALVLTNDSGSMHLADALQRPMVVLFSGTDRESQWRPRRSPSRLLRRPTPCFPCYRFDCPFDLACLDIPPQEVVDRVLDLLGGAGRSARQREREDRS